jgi:uncharacterized protein YpiB (UPF0302 family)
MTEIFVGDIVEIAYQGRDGKMIGEVISKEGTKLYIEILYGEQLLKSYVSTTINIDCNPRIQSHNQVKRLSREIAASEFRFLIDFALDTKDEEWFYELTKRLEKEKVIV